MQSLTFFVGKLGADGIAVVLDELAKKGEQKERVVVFVTLAVQRPAGSLRVCISTSSMKFEIACQNSTDHFV